MTREWKPGDVAASHSGERIFRHGSKWITSRPGFNASKIAPRWEVDDARPLVVIDPVAITGPDETVDEDPIEEIASCLYNLAKAERSDATSGTYRGQVAARLAAAFEAVIPTPPKPDEPTGLGAVVEDADGEWVHFGNGCWIKSVPNAQLQQRAWWDFGDDVRVLSDGMPA